MGTSGPATNEWTENCSSRKTPGGEVRADRSVRLSVVIEFVHKVQTGKGGAGYPAHAEMVSRDGERRKGAEGEAEAD